MPRKGSRTSKVSLMAEQSGLSYSTVHHRLKRGMTEEEATNADKFIPEYLKGSQYTSVKQIADETGLPYGVLKRRLSIGWPIEEAKKPLGYKRKPVSRGRFTDLTGKKFGRLTILKEMENKTKDGHVLWWCVCDCGNHVIKMTKTLTTKRTVPSCGCYIRELTVKRNLSHGLSKHPLYRTYYHMKERCYNENCGDWKYYGGRGIRICDEWLNDVTTFILWGEANGYKKGLTIERIDGDKGYSPDNCTFLTIEEQQYNKHPKGYLEKLEGMQDGEDNG